MADDLGDEWWVEDRGEENVAVSIEEEVESKGKQAGKRRLEDTDQSNEEKQQTKKKKKKKKNITEVLKEQEPQAPTWTDLTSMLQKNCEGKLSAVEMDAMEIQEEHFLPSGELDQSLNDYLQQHIPKWTKRVSGASDAPGSPLLLLVSSAATRVVQVNKDITFFKKKAKIAKLFAKHIKLKEQKEFLSKHVVHIGLGTPNRILNLLEIGALDLSQVRNIVLDWSWRDVKKRRLADIPEVRDDLTKLFVKSFIPHVKSNQAKIGLL